MTKRIEEPYTLSTRSKGNGCDACYVVYHKREIIATFPIIDPASREARDYAERFITTMEETR